MPAGGSIHKVVRGTSVVALVLGAVAVGSLAAGADQARQHAQIRTARQNLAVTSDSPTPLSSAFDWGANESGQLGNGSTSDAPSPVGALLPAGTSVSAVAAGADFTLAVTTSGSVYAWGADDSGQLGNGTTTSHPTPNPVAVSMPAGTTITAVAAGSAQSLALTTSGTVLAWGSNLYGQLGDGTTTDRTVPVPVDLPSGTLVTAVAAGATTSYALTSSGSLYAWGANYNGQLGDGTTDPLANATPVAVNLPKGTTATSIAAGASFGLAVTGSGSMLAWGSNFAGQLGDGMITDSDVPVAVSLTPGITVSQVVAGAYHALALTSAGGVLAWGSNGFGQLGDGSTANSDTPVAVDLPPDAQAQLAAGSGQSVVATDEGVYAWGDNALGQLGTGTAGGQQDTPVPIRLPQPITLVSLGTGAEAQSTVAIGSVPAPTLQTISPAQGPTSGGNTVTLAGAAFLGPATVDFGGVAATHVTVVSPGQITTVVPPGSGSAAVTVKTPVGPSCCQSTAYTYVGPNPYVPVPPVRVLDTRPAPSGPIGVPTAGPLGPGGTVTLDLADIADGVPRDATAVVLNVTVTGPTTDSFLTVYPGGETEPPTSNLNFGAGQTVANLVEVALGAAGPSSGEIQLTNYSGSTNVVADLEGYVAPPGNGEETSLYQPLTPARILDTRPAPSGPIGVPVWHHSARRRIALKVTGEGGVPTSGVSAVVLNVTVTGPTGASWLTVWPDGTTEPTASALNYVPGETVPNRVVAAVPADGKVDLVAASGTTEVVADVTGYFTTSGNGDEFEPAAAPIRLVDTRPATPPVNPYSNMTIAAGSPLTVSGTGVDGIPADASALAANVTVTNPTATSWLTVWPGGLNPGTSDLNYVAGESVPNFDLVTLSAGGVLAAGDFDAGPFAGGTDAIVDVAGWFVASTLTSGNFREVGKKSTSPAD